MKRTSKIAVVGAGAAGVAAAVSAARCGADVLLIDATERLGGAVTAAMHRSLCGLYASKPKDPTDTLNDGIQRELVARMHRLAPADVRPRQFGQAWVLEFPGFAWEQSLAALCDEAGVQRMPNCRVVEIHRNSDRIATISVARVSRPCRATSDTGGTPVPQEDVHRIDPDIIIDCTGGGHVLQLIGDDAMLPDEPRMLGGYSVRLSDLSGEMELLRLQIPYALARAVQTNELPAVARFTTFYPGPGEGQGVCKLAIPLEAIPPEQVPGLADRVIACLVRDIAGFAAAKVIERSPRPLARDGRRLAGCAIVSEDHILSRSTGDRAVHAWWPIERWDPTTGPTYQYSAVGCPYGIPVEALRSAKIENLLAAGACLSATAGAMASIRAAGICLATGDAVGRLALVPSLLERRLG